MKELVALLKEALNRGLEKPDQAVVRRRCLTTFSSDLSVMQGMIPTFVFGWPSGNETGNFLAIDLGGVHICYAFPNNS